MTGSKKYPWIVVGLLWFVALLNYMDRQMLSTMRPSISVDITELESATNFGRLMAIFLWIYGFMSPLAGVVADRVNRKRLIVFSLFIWSAVTFAMSFVTTFNQLYLLRAVMGVSEALYIPAGLALIADYHTSRTRSLAIGIHMSGFYVGQAMGGLGATIADKFTWQFAFGSFGAVGMGYSLLLLFLLKDKGRRTQETISLPLQTKRPPFLQGILLLMTNVSFWMIFFYFSIPSLPGWGVKNWLPTLFSKNLNIDMATAGPLSTITIATSSFVGVIAGGILSDWWVQRNIRGRIYTSAIGLGLMIPALLLMGFGDSLAHVFSAAVCFGVGFGLFDGNNMPILCQFVTDKSRATAYGLMNMGGVFSGAFITDWMGRSTDAGNLDRCFAVLSIVVAVALLLLLFLLRPKVKDYDELASKL